MPYQWIEPDEVRLFLVLKHPILGVQHFPQQQHEELLHNSQYKLFKKIEHNLHNIMGGRNCPSSQRGSLAC
jgi:hypothetical protein